MIAPSDEGLTGAPRQIAAALQRPCLVRPSHPRDTPDSAEARVTPVLTHVRWSTVHWLPSAIRALPLMAGASISPVTGWAAVGRFRPVPSPERLLSMVTPEVPAIHQLIPVLAGEGNEGMANRPLLTEVAVAQADEAVVAVQRYARKVRLFAKDGRITDSEREELDRDEAEMRREQDEAHDAVLYAHNAGKFAAAVQRGVTDPQYLEELGIRALRKPPVRLDNYRDEPLDAA